MREAKTRYYLNVRVDNLTSDMALQRVEELVTQSKKNSRVFFTNVHSIHLSRKDPDLRAAINGADMVLPDGSGLMIAGRLLGKPIRENLNGTDFTPKVCEMAEARGWSVYLLGAKEEVVERCYENLQQRFPGLRLKGYHHGYFNEREEQSVIAEINNVRPDILLVALGSPLQEKWAARHASQIKVGVCFAVGGLFDFISQGKPRAPLWIRRLGMEWLFRFMQDPLDKWERIFIEIPVFLGLILTRNRKLISEEANPSLDWEEHL